MRIIPLGKKHYLVLQNRLRYEQKRQKTEHLYSYTENPSDCLIGLMYYAELAFFSQYNRSVIRYIYNNSSSVAFIIKRIFALSILLNLTAVNCNPPCANGVCSTQGQCVCSAGWTGSICTIGKHSQLELSNSCSDYRYYQTC